MQEILFDYKLNPTTWAYISALMLIGTYFKFRRFWSVRNLDLAGLIAFSPGLLLVYYGLLKQTPDWCRAGYVWLFAVGAFFLIRLLLDPVMVRRPLLEPNLSASGLTFTGIALLVFLMANVITRPPERLGMVAGRAGDAGQRQPRVRFLLHLRRICEPEDPGLGRRKASRGLSADVDSRGRHPRRGHLRAPGRAAGHDLDRFPPFRQYPYRRGRRDALPADLLHQPVHQPGRSRGAGHAAGVGRGRLSPAPRFRECCWDWREG